MKINYMSDLHLEFEGAEMDPGEGEVLILAGDICTASSFEMRGEEDKKETYLNFFIKCVENYKKVFYVMGNHESYSFFFDETEKTLRENLPEGITLLHNQSEYYNGVHFVGATMWTDFNKGDGVTLELARHSMNDYNCVYKKSTMDLLDPKDTLKEHGNTSTWFDQVLPTLNGPVVVITHHAPSEQSFKADYREEEIKPAYVVNMEPLMKKSDNVKLWIHGHIHETNDYQVAGCRVVSNPRGYYGFELNPGFDVNKTVEINNSKKLDVS